MPHIATAKVTDRRKLHYESIDGILADIDRIVAADKAGTLRRTGNWTAGQTFGHLATWIDFGYNGYPMKVPWFIRFVIRVKLKKYLRQGMDAGVHIPKIENGTFGTEPLSTAEGARRLRASLQRLRTEPPRFQSPAFGDMTDADRMTLNLRHAELHMSFLHP